MKLPRFCRSSKPKCIRSSGGPGGAFWIAFASLWLAALPGTWGAQSGNFLYSTNGMEVTITGYDGPGGPLEIPAALDGLPVTVVGATAFYGRSSLTSVTIPSGVMAIGQAAFSECTGLTVATLPASVAVIGKAAFVACTNLVAVYFQGDAPQNGGPSLFANASQATIYCRPGTTGWGYEFGGRPVVVDKAGQAAGLVLMNPVRETTGWRITFSTAARQSYQVDFADALNGWQPLLAGIQGDGRNMSVMDETLQPGRFYRVATTASNPPPVRIGWVAPGSFNLGSSQSEKDRDNDEGPATTAVLTKGFWIGVHEVTQAQYLSLVGNNPSHFTGDLARPVEQVGWAEATNYCALLTACERSAGRLPAGCLYRLPTEAEWERACRAGTVTRFDFRDDLDYSLLPDHAWFDASSRNQTHPVGFKIPNQWGLFDMHGNVWEWCQDWYGPYPGGAVVDGSGPLAGVYRVIRGGSWFSYGSSCRSANRNASHPETHSSLVGFRPVLAPPLPD